MAVAIKGERNGRNQDNKRRTGAEYEQIAIAYLESQGMQIKERNYRTRYGEIDIIGSHQGFLVFVEVKYRSSTRKGTAAEAVNRGKQRVICKVADYYRMMHKIGENIGVRYDVIAIQGKELTWYQDAFEHIYG